MTSSPRIWISASLLAVCSCRDATEQEVWSLGGQTMGVEYSVKIAGREGEGEKLGRSVASLLEILDGKLTTYRKDSEVGRFSAFQGTNWFEVSESTARVVAQAQQVSGMTDGAFDVTADPLVRMWGFGPERKGGVLPADAEIRAALARVGFRRLYVRADPPALRKDYCDVSVDLSGIAKGFAVDQVAGLLEALRVTNYLVTIGGELRARGVWKVGIEKPDGDGGQVQHILELRDAAASTSGDYRNFFERDGRRFPHVLDPRTGWPVTNGVASVTVLHTNSATADALATALMVMGPEEGLKFADEQRLTCLFLLRQGGGFVEKASPQFPADDGVPGVPGVPTKK